MELEENILPNLVKAVSDELDADIYLISGSLHRGVANDLIDLYAESERRDNCALILSTYGGDADAAFIIARFLKRFYKRFTLYVFGMCKSAGTLIALGADEIVMSVHAEFGPLDVQMLRDDELGVQNSGLDILQALATVHAQAFEVFEESFLKIKSRSGGTITTKTAADIATTLATTLLTPISAQIDPLRLGEMQRAVNIAMRYGEKLGANPEALANLIYLYPCHSFVIDYEEAEALFGNVRPVSEVEQVLEQVLRVKFVHELGVECIHVPYQGALVTCLTKAPNQESANEDINEESGSGGETVELSVGSADEATIQTGGNNGQQGERSAERITTIQKNGA